MTDRKLFTTIEAAESLGMSDSNLRTLIAKRKAIPAQKIGGTYVFTADEIERIRQRPISKGGRPPKK